MEPILKDLAVIAVAAFGSKLLDSRRARRAEQAARRMLRELRGIRRDLHGFRGFTLKRLRRHGREIGHAHARIDRHDERAQLDTRALIPPQPH